MTVPTYRSYIDGKWCSHGAMADVKSPYSQSLSSQCAIATPEDLDAAVAAASRVFVEFSRSTRAYRSQLLSAMASAIDAHRTDFVTTMILEAGKPRSLADIEVSRAVMTFTAAAEEAKRFGGEVIPLDGEIANADFGNAYSLWFAKSPILAITPFNFPLNLVAHKVAPALAVGAPVIVKPAPAAPGCAYLLAKIFDDLLKSDAGLRAAIPSAALQVLLTPDELTGEATKDPRIGVVSFTGSQRVGYKIQSMAVGKKVALELGGNAAAIVNEDADLGYAAKRCAYGAFAYAGQICISVQRILVHTRVEQEFTKLLLDEVAKIACGDPESPQVLCGPMINQDAADRLLAWITDAVSRGATILAGGNQSDTNTIAPTVLFKVPKDLPLYCEEAFGPVAVLESYASFEDAVAMVNDSRFGLQAGVFTDSAALRYHATRYLDVGSIIFNDVPTYRADNMPYGGVKASGLGREGVRFAMEEYSERKTVVSRNVF